MTPVRSPALQLSPTLGFAHLVPGAVAAHVCRFAEDDSAAAPLPHAWNFMPLLGCEGFDNRLMVLSAGVMEVVFGTIRMLGVVTRLNDLVVAVLILTSNIVFRIERRKEDALLDLIGRLPIASTTLILLLLGTGQGVKRTPRRASVSSVKPPVFLGGEA